MTYNMYHTVITGGKNKGKKIEKKKKSISQSVVILPGEEQRPYIIETMHSYTLPM